MQEIPHFFMLRAKAIFQQHNAYWIMVLILQPLQMRMGLLHYTMLLEQVNSFFSGCVHTWSNLNFHIYLSTCLEDSIDSKFFQKPAEGLVWRIPPASVFRHWQWNLFCFSWGCCYLPHFTQPKLSGHRTRVLRSPSVTICRLDIWVWMIKSFLTG